VKEEKGVFLSVVVVGRSSQVDTSNYYCRVFCHC